ncbi:uncharacterized protein PHA67_007229 isoform 2-T5 [Liasis olivaceus]
MKNVGARIVTAAEPMEHTDASHGIWTNPERRLMRNGRGFNGNFSAVPGRLAGRERYRALRAAGGTAFFRCPESVAATRIFSWTLLRFDDRFLPAPLEGGWLGANMSVPLWGRSKVQSSPCALSAELVLAVPRFEGRREVPARLKMSD